MAEPLAQLNLSWSLAVCDLKDLCEAEVLPCRSVPRSRQIFITGQNPQKLILFSSAFGLTYHLFDLIGDHLCVSNDKVGNLSCVEAWFKLCFRMLSSCAVWTNGFDTAERISGRKSDRLCLIDSTTQSCLRPARLI